MRAPISPDVRPKGSLRSPRWRFCLALLWGIGLLALGLYTGGIGDRQLPTLLGLALIDVGLAWLALASLRRHLAAARAQAEQPYVVRHRGLLFAAPMGSFMAGWNVRRWLESAATPTAGEIVYITLLMVTVVAPIALWAGGLWQRGFDAGMDVLSDHSSDDAER